VKPPSAIHSSVIGRGTARRPSSRAQRPPQRECIALSDATDCLLEAYDVVSRRAYENFLTRGAGPDGELQDWFRAERDLLLNFPIHLQESDRFVYALASVPGATAERLALGIESRWLVILAHHARNGHDKPDATEGLCASLHSGDSRGLEPQLEEDRPAKSVCIVELPADVDAARAIAVLSDGILGIRMPKRTEPRNSKLEIAK
jgi:HSP20 family molecular chaperone IbpA